MTIEQLREPEGTGRYATHIPSTPEVAVAVTGEHSVGMKRAHVAAKKLRIEYEAAVAAYQAEVGEALEGLVTTNWPGADKISFEYDHESPDDLPNLRGVFDAAGDKIDAEQPNADKALMLVD